MPPSLRVLLIDPADEARRILTERLTLQGFTVVECRDGAEGAIAALQSTPAVVVADLSMPSISGVQLCRLLKSESSTSHVPVVLRGPGGQRNRFWAEQAGAYAYVVKGRMGELVRALRRALRRVVEQGPRSDATFFVQSSTEGLDVRERIAAHLDAALFDSVVAAEVRRLGATESFDRLMDLLSQFVSQVTSYRWMAVTRDTPPRFGLHVNANCRERMLAEARTALGVSESMAMVTIEDEDAVDDLEGPPAICERIPFGDGYLGTIGLAPRAPVHHSDPILIKTIARELGGALRMATLVEESRLTATTDMLTGLLNRRAFLEWATRELRRAERYRDSLSVVVLDVDHFKQVNDRYGHATGDNVLAFVGSMLPKAVRSCDVVARYGGEEFVLALPSTPLQGAVLVAERARRTLEEATVQAGNGSSVPVTASFGVAQLNSGETIDQLIDRADRAMYAAKSGGRNRVETAESLPDPRPHASAPVAVHSAAPPHPVHIADFLGGKN
ncbi:MAG TPA: diguanylate cyclase [Polyangiales bacterium]|nr:diguanylate cyclase [Polyangiales bacterium]